MKPDMFAHDPSPRPRGEARRGVSGERVIRGRTPTLTLPRKRGRGLGACLLLALALPLTAFAAGDQLSPKEKDFSFEGFLGTVDRQSAQRGLQVYREVCASCHGLERVPFRRLVDLGFSEGEVKALAREYEIQDGPDDAGDMFARPGLPSDYFPSPFANEQAARASNGGAYPPDLSLITKARLHGPEYLYSLLTGYEAVPQYRCIEARGTECVKFERAETSAAPAAHDHGTYPEGQHDAAAVTDGATGIDTNQPQTGKGGEPAKGSPQGGPTAAVKVNSDIDNSDPQQGALTDGTDAAGRGQGDGLAVPADNLRQGGGATVEGMASEQNQKLDTSTAAPGDTAVTGAITTGNVSAEGQVFACVAIDHGEGRDENGETYAKETCRPLGEGMHYNPYFPGGQIAMPPPIGDGQVSYGDNTEASREQIAEDLVNFLQWAAEPEMEARKEMGLKVMAYLLIATVLVWLAKRRIWRRVH